MGKQLHSDAARKKGQEAHHARIDSKDSTQPETDSILEAQKLEQDRDLSQLETERLCELGVIVEPAESIEYLECPRERRLSRAPYHV